MKEYKYKINGEEYNVTINEVSDTTAQVEVNGTSYTVEWEKPETPKPEKEKKEPREVREPKADNTEEAGEEQAKKPHRRRNNYRRNRKPKQGGEA